MVDGEELAVSPGFNRHDPDQGRAYDQERQPMKIDITPQAEELLAKRGGTMAVDFIKPVG